jgi:uncharacterized protein (DUF2236 family)
MNCPIHKMKDDGPFGPDTLTWKTGAEIAIAVAATGAGLLQMLHPDVVRVVNESGKYYENPAKRAERTALYGSSITYGDTKIAAAASEAFQYLHNSLRAQDPVTGEWYTASEPRLLLWVHNSLIWMILKAYKQYGPRLTPQQENEYIKEQHIAAKLAGLDVALLPNNKEELDLYMEQIKPQLALTLDSLHFRDFYLQPKRFSIAGFFERIFIRAGVELIPADMRALFGIKTSRFGNHCTRIITKATLLILRKFFPSSKLIAEKRQQLLCQSFGEGFLKRGSR